MNTPEIFVDPRTRIVFATQYIYGICQKFGLKSVKFRMHPFVELDHLNDPRAFDHYFAIIIQQGSERKKVVIDIRDDYSINHNAYQWCDRYGKVNLNTGKTPAEYLDKSLSLGPMVAPRIWDYQTTMRYAISNYLKSRKHLNVGWKYFFSAYRWQLERPWLEDYLHNEWDRDYIFFDSTLWVTEKSAESTNEWRSHFIRTCRSLDLQFQGGLYTRKEHPNVEKFSDVLANEYVDQKEYLRRIKRSALVFNTPSVHQGHGWKLGEFLAMGKAMISTTVKNDMPVPLEHGKNIHFIKDKDEMRDAIQKIRKDDAYRIRLQTGAREYYDTYLKPLAVINRLFDGVLTTATVSAEFAGAASARVNTAKVDGQKLDQKSKVGKV